MRSNVLAAARGRAVAAIFLGFVSFSAFAGSPPADPVDASEQLKARTAPTPINPHYDRVGTQGGWINFYWNDDMLADFGVSRKTSGGTVDAGVVPRIRFNFHPASTFEFDRNHKGIPGFSTGIAQFDGGFQFKTAAGNVDWRQVKAVLRPQQPIRIDFVSTDGEVLFYGDRVMYALSRDGAALNVESMDLRIAPAFAQRIGRPEAADQAVADVQFQSPIASAIVAEQPLGCGAPNWPNSDVPGVPGAKFQADVFMIGYSMSHSRCRATPSGGACDGPGGATDGYVVYTPSSTLSNNRNNGTATVTVPGDPLGTSSALHTADVRWLRKFAGIVAPYNNDQHPYLVWNMYRMESDGRITQIGKSGVKHAFVSTNTDPGGCSGATCCQDCNGGNVLGRNCTDTYGTGNNDSPNDLGPRSEIIPAKGLWGRCGSIYDTNCSGDDEDFGGYTNFDHRMLVRESSIDPALNTGDTFMSESWYIVRDDVNVENTMATRPMSVNWSGSQWSPSNGSPFRLGPVIDRWYDAAPGGQQKLMSPISDKDGHAKIAVRVVDLGGGSFRYDYVVMNLDFARAETSGAEPNLRVISNRGFNSFSVALPTVAVTTPEFADADIDAANDWTSTVSTSEATWTVPSANTNTLDYASLYRFSFVSSAPPVAGVATLGIALAGSPATLSAPTLVPQGSVVPPDPMFEDGFEDD